jgi:hypothetical protein
MGRNDVAPSYSAVLLLDYTVDLMGRLGLGRGPTARHVKYYLAC